MKLDLFEHGDHKHLCGDSTDEKNYLALMGEEQASLILADPPYCLLVRRNKKTGQLRDEKKAKINHEAVRRFEKVRDYKFFTKAWMSVAAPYLKDDGIFIVWTNFFGKKPTIEIANELGFKYFYGEFIWGKLSKENSGNEVLARVYEVALVFSRGPLSSEKDLNSLPIPWSVITKYDEEGEAADWGNHPNHKPFSSLSPLIRSYSKIGDIILDPFSGSGSTPAAVISLERNIRGIELRSEWAEITRKRIKALS